MRYADLYHMASQVDIRTLAREQVIQHNTI